MATNNQTVLQLMNGTDQSVQTYLTLGAAPGCIQNVADVPFVTNVVSSLQGWFELAGNGSVSYMPPAGVGFNGNFAYCSGNNHPPPYVDCQSAPICNVQRDASTAGGTVVITFTGFTQALA